MPSTVRSHSKVSRKPRLNIGQYWKNYKHFARDSRKNTIQTQRVLFARIFKPRVSLSTRFILEIIERELAQGMTVDSFIRVQSHALRSLEEIGISREKTHAELTERCNLLYVELQRLAAMASDVKLKQADLMRKGLVTFTDLMSYNKFSHAFHNEAHRRILFLSELLHSLSGK